MAAYTAPGWYGKLPSTGDFLHHRLSEQQISPWNHWFQQGLMHWHQQAYSYSADFLHAPVWNFVLPVTATRPQIQMGCLLPSCDRVGRAWPLLALHSFTLAQWHPAQLTIRRLVSGSGRDTVTGGSDTAERRAVRAADTGFTTAAGAGQEAL
jgi:type VI secretion system protein ImpM